MVPLGLPIIFPVLTMFSSAFLLNISLNNNVCHCLVVVYNILLSQAFSGQSLLWMSMVLASFVSPLPPSSNNTLWKNSYIYCNISEVFVLFKSNRASRLTQPKFSTRKNIGKYRQIQLEDQLVI